MLVGISRIVAENPSVMTYHGTNTWIVEDEDGVAIVDPGPDSEAHASNVLSALNGAPVRRILLTHSHSDHWGNTALLKAMTGAPVLAYRHPIREGFTPDIPLDPGTLAGGFKAIHTPGHAADHLCFQFCTKDKQKILFTGDHVMSWSSSIVSPPDGDMGDYYRSLELLLERDDDIYLCGHGPMLREPRVLVSGLLSHRRFREQTILEELRKQDWDVASLAAKLYHKADRQLQAASQRNVLSHLLKLKEERIVEELMPGTERHMDAAGPMPDGVTAETGAVASTAHRDSMRRFGLIR